MKIICRKFYVKPLSANPEKWSNTLKQLVGNLPTNCLSVFDHFMNLALKGLKHLYVLRYAHVRRQGYTVKYFFQDIS